jgi:hypothetical protein
MKTGSKLAIGFGAMTVLVATPAAAACQPPIKLDVSGPRPTVEMTTRNGRSGVAVFDTGSMGAIISPELARQLGLAKEGPVGAPFDRLAAANTYSSTLRGLRLAGVPVGDIPVPVVPSPVPGISGILSPQIFRGKLVEVNLGKAQLRLCDRAAGLAALGPGTPYSGGPFPLPAIPVTVGPTKVAAHIDTGSPMALGFPLRFAKQFALASPLKQTGAVQGHNGVHPIYVAKIKGTVQVGPLTLTNPEARFSDVFPMPNVGTALLRQVVLTIDPQGQRSWTRAADQHRQ